MALKYHDTKLRRMHSGQADYQARDTEIAWDPPGTFTITTQSPDDGSRYSRAPAGSDQDRAVPLSWAIISQPEGTPTAQRWCKLNGPESPARKAFQQILAKLPGKTTGLGPEAPDLTKHRPPSGRASLMALRARLAKRSNEP